MLVSVGFVYFVFLCLILLERRKIGPSLLPRSPRSDGKLNSSFSNTAVLLRAPGRFVLVRKTNNSSVCVCSIMRRSNKKKNISLIFTMRLLVDQRTSSDRRFNPGS